MLCDGTAARSARMVTGAPGQAEWPAAAAGESPSMAAALAAGQGFRHA